MFRIIESKEDLVLLKSKLNQVDKIFIEPVMFNDNFHPILNNISCLYINVYKGENFLITISHNDSESCSITSVYALLTDLKCEIWSRDKKTVLYFFPIKSIKQLNLNHLEEINNSLVDWYYHKYHSLENINCIIPIVKLFERCEEIYDSIEKYMDLPLNPVYDKGVLAFLNIEKNGIRITNEFENYFNPEENKFSIKDNIIYTHYNLFTTTKRPSNSFNNINFLALNKTNGSKTCFIPKNDKFLEIDISAYHPTLISQLIDYKFEEDEIHSHLSKLYKVDYNKSKEITFKQLYGGIYSQYKDLEFFKKTQALIDKIWLDYNNGGYVTKSGILIKDVETPVPNKVFNYVLQELETSNNIEIIFDIIKLLLGKKSHLVLYVYDSFVIDLKEDEDLIGEIEKIFKKRGLTIKYKIKSTLD